jgi:hypothetical protein
MFRHFLSQKVVEQKRQQQQNIPHIHSAYPVLLFASFPDAIEDVSKPRSYWNQTVKKQRRNILRLLGLLWLLIVNSNT